MKDTYFEDGSVRTWINFHQGLTEVHNSNATWKMGAFRKLEAYATRTPEAYAM